MAKNFSFFAILTIFCVCFLTCILPYPVFQKTANITASDIEKINNHNEIELSISEPNSNIIVTNLNWFDCTNDLFPTFMKTRIIDVETGKEFYVYRVGGINHADIETIDADNTAILLEIYNNAYSWKRRAVWVEIKPNLWVAGSINGYPHGETYISDNNMTGHFCLHFLESKTHGTKRVDKAHQNCISYAYKNKEKIVKYLKNNDKNQ